MDAWREKEYVVVGLEGDVFSQAWWTTFKAKCGVAACMIEVAPMWRVVYWIPNVGTSFTSCVPPLHFRQG